MTEARTRPMPETPAPGEVAKRLEEIRKRVDAATKGPWGAWISGATICVSAPNGKRRDGVDQIIHWTGFDACYEPIEKQKTNARFIANARSDVPYLLDLIDTLSRREAEMRAALRDTADTLEQYYEDGEPMDWRQWVADLRSLSGPNPTPDTEKENEK